MSFEKVNNNQHMEHMKTKVLKTYVSYGTSSRNKVDEVVDNFKHLRMNESYRKLHCFHANRLGVDRFIQLARTAELEGKNPGKYFTWLLKHES